MSTVQRDGVRLGQELNCYLPADATIKPLRNQIFAEPLPWTPSKIIEVVSHAKPLRAKVLAIGPGNYPKRYNGPKGARTKSWDSKAFRKCDVKVGDVIQLGGLEIGGYLFPRITWGNKDVVICTEDDVVGVE